MRVELFLMAVVTSTDDAGRVGSYVDDTVDSCLNVRMQDTLTYFIIST